MRHGGAGNNLERSDIAGMYEHGLTVSGALCDSAAMVQRVRVCFLNRMAILLAMVGACLCVGVCHLFAQDTNVAEVGDVGPPVVRVDFFFEQGCADCARVRREVLPVLQGSLDGFYRLYEWDVGLPENHRKLLALLSRTEAPLSDNATVYMFVDGTRSLVGVEAIAADLLNVVEEQLTTKMSMDYPPLPAMTDVAPIEKEAVVRISKQFTLLGVGLAGLIDGINPCAIATLVFLVSVLSMSNIVGGNLLLIGAVFCLGSFLTYFLLGLGMLHILHQMTAFRLVQGAFDMVLVAVLLLLAGYSFLDAFRFRRSHRASDVSIQLPVSVKNRVHRLLRLGLGKHGTILSAFLVAVAVTALESVCTGQVYLPTLAFIVRSGADVGRGMGLLVVYNLMFIVPLLVVLILAHHGLRLQRLMAWSAKEVFFGKLLMGLFFVAMAVLIVML
jgi:cytochrome c biogenesis protein CcdA